jgi:N-methylhydantoinase B
VNITQSAFARLGDGHGLAEGGTGLGAGMAVLSGNTTGATMPATSTA